MRFEGSDASDAPGGGGGVFWEDVSEDMVVGGYEGALVRHVILACRSSSNRRYMNSLLSTKVYFLHSIDILYIDTS